MSEGLNELEAALRKLQPAPVVQGPMLVEMGRASAVRSARKWRWVSASSSTVAMALAAILVMRPEPATRVQFVNVPSVVPVEEIRETSSEPIEPMESPLPAWRFRQFQVRVPLEPVSAEGDDEPFVEPRPVRAGDVMRDPSLWSSFTNSGVR
jgi:hypothetical protein